MLTKQHVSVLGSITAGSLIAATAMAGGGDVFTVNTANGTINGASNGVINGVPYTFLGNIEGGTIAQFRIDGNLNLLDDQVLRGSGTRGVSLIVANDVHVATTAEILMNAMTDSGPGGGAGGAGGASQSGGGGSIVWGTGGVPGVPGAGGTACIGGLPGLPGLPGGVPGTGAFDLGGHSSTGLAGTDGINAPSSAGNSRSRSTSDGANGGNGGGGAAGGGGGSGGSPGGGNGSSGGGGVFGKNGTAGQDGLHGLNGFPGSNTGNGALISGGGAGGGGTGGEGGAGGGAGGGGGSGGGGGGGGSWCQVFPPLVHNGGAGGAGGAGGRGNEGGDGGSGGVGGVGGNGGGAIEIIALGSITVDGFATVQGGDGTINVGSPGAAGLTGLNGFSGSSGTNVSGNGGTGGNGGAGRKGGNGGAGGDGGDGGRGGGGAGGTLKFVATAFLGDGELEVRGGNVGLTATGGSGRLLIGASAGDSFTGDRFGSSGTAIAALTEVNPYLFTDPETETPYITNLVGGADLYGLTGLTDADFASILADAPADAVAAMIRLDVLPNGYMSDDDAHDVIAIINLDDNPMTDPAFAAGALDDAAALAERGVANNVQFGGSGPQTMTQLESGAVWITLVPDASSEFVLRGNALEVTSDSLADDDAVYLLPSACPGDVDGNIVVNVADLLALLAAWGPNPGHPADFDDNGEVNVSDLLALLAAWGACP